MTPIMKYNIDFTFSSIRSAFGNAAAASSSVRTIDDASPLSDIFSTISPITYDVGLIDASLVASSADSSVGVCAAS